MSVKVIRERSDQRRHHRVTAPLFVEHDGHRIRATDWSLGGLRIDGFSGQLPEIGDTLKLGISLPFQGFDVNFTCEAEVVRRLAETKTFSVRYVNIGERELGLLEHFIDELIRGSMVDVKETIQRIDVPVTPASTKPDPNPLAKVPISRWPTRTIAYAALYLTIGLFVFGYAAVIAYTNFVRMEVDTAVTASPLESVRAQVNGRIAYGRYRQGDPVPRGAVVLSVTDNDLERQIDLATIDIKDKTAQLAALERQLLEELERVNAFAQVEGKNLDQVRLEVQSLEAQAKAAAALHRRLSHLRKQGYATATNTDNAEKQMIAAQKLVQAKALELQTRASLANYNAGSRLYNGTTFSGDRARIEAQAMLARDQVTIAERKLRALLDHRDRLAVYAPFDGVLQELPRPDGSMVRAGDVIATIENPKAREIWAFMRQDEVLSVGLGDEVKIYLPGLSELRTAKVTRIDRTSGFVSEMHATYIWRAPRDRSAKVVLEFSDPEPRAFNDAYRTGMPAVAIFSKRPTNYLIGDMMHRFRMVFGGRSRTAPDTADAAKASNSAETAAQGAQAKGPPRNYEPSADPVRDPDAVAARRLGNQPEALRPAPSAASGQSSATRQPARNVVGDEETSGPLARVGETYGVAKELFRGLLPRSSPAEDVVPGAKPAEVAPAQSSPRAPDAPPPLSGARSQAASASIAPPPVGAWREGDARRQTEGRSSAQAVAPASSEERAGNAVTPRDPRRPIEAHSAPPPGPRPAPRDDVEQVPSVTQRDHAASSPPRGTASGDGFFSRLEELVRKFFAITPQEDEDWGGDPSLASPAPHPNSPALRSSAVRTPHADPGLATPLREAAPATRQPAQQRRPTTAAVHAQDRHRQTERAP